MQLVGSKNNLSVYGPKCWFVIHTLAGLYTKSLKNEFLDVLNIIKKTFPCELCRQNMTSHLIKCPITENDFENADTLLKWTCKFHNIVNKDKDKYNHIYYECSYIPQVRNYYLDKKQRCSEITDHFTFVLFGITKSSRDDINRFIFLVSKFLYEPEKSKYNLFLNSNYYTSCNFKYIYTFYKTYTSKLLDSDRIKEYFSVVNCPI